jgi:hypothetical protein
MKISKAHKEFAVLLEAYYEISKQDVLDHPENFLGPNWEAVINFWLYLDTLSYEQLRVAGRVVGQRYMALRDKNRDIASGRAYDGAVSTTKYAHEAVAAAYDSVSCAKYAAYYATVEIIGLDKLLEQGYQPVFYPLFLRESYKNCKPIKTMNDIRPKSEGGFDNTPTVINSDEKEDQKKLKTALTIAISENYPKIVTIEAIERAVNRALQELEQ